MNDMVRKWGNAVAGKGFTQLPNYLLLLNQFLDEDRRLSPTEVLVLYQLVGAWWKPDDMPFPAITTLAERCGVSSRQVQRAVTALEKADLIRRVKRQRGRLKASNAYDLSPLVRTLEQISKAFPNKYPRKMKVADKPIPESVEQTLSDGSDGVTPSVAQQVREALLKA